MLSRRQFVAALPASGVLCDAAPRTRITAVQPLVLQGPRTYVLVRVDTDRGVSGVGEAPGSPVVGVKEGVLALRPEVLGRDPLELDALFRVLLNRAPGRGVLSAAGAIEMALWDIAGKLLDVPASTLLGGRHREQVRVSVASQPRTMLSVDACREWADRLKAHPAGYTAVHLELGAAPAAPQAWRDVIRGIENCRGALGADIDIVLDCGGQFDLPAAIRFCELVAPVAPLSVEDPLPAGYAEAWTRLTGASRVPICTGGSLGARQDFAAFVSRRGCDILSFDVRNTGGLLESKRIAETAGLAHLPVAAKSSGTVVSALATAHCAAACPDFTLAQLEAGRGNWMDDLIVREGPLVNRGHLTVPAAPGLGFVLNGDAIRSNLAAGESYWQ